MCIYIYIYVLGDPKKMCWLRLCLSMFKDANWLSPVGRQDPIYFCKRNTQGQHWPQNNTHTNMYLGISMSKHHLISWFCVLSFLLRARLGLIGWTCTFMIPNASSWSRQLHAADGISGHSGTSVGARIPVWNCHLYCSNHILDNIICRAVGSNSR